MSTTPTDQPTEAPASGGMAIRHFRCPEQLWREFNAHARAEGVGAAEILRGLIRDYNARQRDL